MRVAAEAGGLSGAPLKLRATQVLEKMYVLTEGRVPIIGSGGISSGKDAYQRIRAGARCATLFEKICYGLEMKFTKT